jgi:hypothetical protein
MRGRRPDGWSEIVNYHIRCTSVRTTAVRRSNGQIQTGILALWTHASGRDTTSSGRLIDLPFLEFGKNQGTVRELIGVRTCCWTVWRPDGMTHRPDGWSSRQMGVQTADRELEFSSNLDITLKVESLFTASLRISDFVQTQNKAKILTLFSCDEKLCTIQSSLKVHFYSLIFSFWKLWWERFILLRWSNWQTR